MHHKIIPLSESSLFKAELQENCKQFEFPWHHHPEYELTYILNGNGVRYVGNSIESYFENDLLLIGSNLPHCWINTPDREQPAKAIVIYLKEEFLDNAWMKSFEFERISKLLTQSKNGLKFDKTFATHLRSKLLKLLELPCFEKLMRLLEILQEMAQSNQSQCVCEAGYFYELNHANDNRINTIYQFIQEHHERKISLAEVAASVNMNEIYFSRFFSKLMKKPFFEFLNEYRINKACKLLIETDKQVAEICYASGFESIPFFYRQFKRFKNCKPKKYRLDFQKAFM
jgi:AraC-like DNA-binding protein/quercetin dioxygenase-like cupin family protein